MNKAVTKLFNDYKNLVGKIDKHADSLEDKHKKFMKCKNGCDLCCMDFSVFPLEYHFILNEIETDKTLPVLESNVKEGVCSFLKNHSCTIYKHRPIMCRTHGLPLIYANDEGEPELSACELNFTEYDFNDFTMENTLPQDKYNSKLFLINRDFISAFGDSKYTETDLIPLKNLAKHIVNI